MLQSCLKKFLRTLHPCFIVAVLAVLTSSAVLFAQVESGRIVGTVHDSTGAVIQDAAVLVKRVDTGLEWHAATGSAGEFTVTQLQPGFYTVLVRHEGFKQAEQQAFKLDANQVVNVRLALEVGSNDQIVQVSAAEPLVESQTSSLGQVMEQTAIHSLPLNGRNFVQLAYLTPGVNSGPQGAVQQGGIPENERGNGSIQANGLTATNNNFLLNGFDNNEQQIGFEIVQLPIDAIEEFKMQTNGFGADIGKGGAVVNVTQRSGSNQFHGSAYEFIRNSALDAKNYFDSATAPITPFKQNQFGGTIGGPILKNKAFFFFDYQGTRIRQSQTDLSTVPTPAERTGDFSSLLTGVINPATGYDTGQIFNPLSYNKVTGARDPFVGNIIPQKYLDSAALNVAALYPSPNRPGIANNYLSTPLYRNDQNQFDTRVDAQLSANDNMFAFFDYGKVDAVKPDPFPGKAGGGSFTGDIKNVAISAGLSEVHTFSGKMINEFKLGYSRYAIEAAPFFSNEDLATQLGIPGVNVSEQTGGLPAISISGYSSLGNQDWFPELLRENNYQILDSFTYIVGRHTMKFGGDLRLRRHGMFQTQNPRGDLSFDQQFTEDLVSGSGGDALASFLLGYPISMYRDGLKGLYGMNWWEVSGYGMDDYRVTPKLTLNLGLRYDIFTPQVEDHDRLANFDFTTGQFISPSQPGIGRAGRVVTDLNNFAPRIGFAYSPHGEKTAVRGAFGVFYDLQANQSDAELAYNPTGYFGTQVVQNTPSTPTMKLSNGFPALEYPTIANPSGRASATKFDNRTTYIEEWNLNLEQSLGRDMIMQIAYVGTHGLKLAWLKNVNQPLEPRDSNFASAPNFGRPYFSTVPGIASIREVSNSASISAHALQVKLEKKLNRSWSLLTAYTWQHTIGQVAEDETAEPQNTHNLSAERGNNDPDFRHQFSSAWTYILPFGKGQRLLQQNNFLQWIAGGWQTQGILSAHSGEAFTPYLSYDPTNTGSGGPRPDLVGQPYDFSSAGTYGCPSNHQSIACWYNPGAFRTPSLAPGQTYAHQFGDAARGILRGPANYNVDLSLFKNFDVREHANVQFRTEAFNLFNNPQFGLPSSQTDTTAAGSISGTEHASRQLQFALKISF